MKKLIQSRFTRRTLLLVCGCMAIGLAAFVHHSGDDRFTRSKQFCTLENGIKLAFVQAGDPAGKPVVLLHGYSDTGRSFQLVADQLLKRDPGLRIIMPDLRGHGASSMPTDSICAGAPEQCFRIADFASDIVGLMNHLGIPRAHVAGHSMGSMIAQYLALFHPERIDGIVLVATVTAGEASPMLEGFIIGEMLEKQFRPAVESAGLSWPKEAYRIAPRDLGDGVIRFLREQWVTESVADPGFLETVAKETVATKLGTWIGSALALRDFDHRKQLGQLRVPTLVLSAIQDPVASEVPDETNLFAPLDVACRNGNAVIYHKMYGHDDHKNGVGQDLGHNFLWAVPEAVADDIVSFVNTKMPAPTHTYLDDTGHVVSAASGGNVIKWPRNTRE